MMSAPEALFGFCGWLTSREPKTVLGASCDCAPIPPLITEFCAANGLKEPRDGWDKELVHPKGD
jgi:hypothetical protein